jgi:hypothetical protein
VAVRLGRDIALILGAFALCPLAAALAPGDPSRPLARLRSLEAFERGRGLYFEPRVWHWFQERPALLAVAGFLYIWGHVPATVGALVWARLERPAFFGLARDAFLATQIVVVLGYLLVPTAPPRMLLDGVDVGGFVHTVQSPYASMPSGHVAFAVLVAVVVGSQVRALRPIAWVYPAVVTAMVIGTANHLWVDALAGTSAAATGFALAVMGRTLADRGSNRGRRQLRSQHDHVGLDASPPRRRARPATRA